MKEESVEHRLATGVPNVFNIQWNLTIEDTNGDPAGCPVWRGVRNLEVD